VDPLWFAVGTLTRVPVPAPRRVDRWVAGWGLVLAPGIGLLVGLTSAVPLLAGRPDLLSRLLTATLTVGLGAWLTRGLHWDGLADLTDGLGSRRPPEGALAVMRASDIGTFATLVVLFAVLVQIFSVALLPAGGPAVAGWVCAQVAARVALGMAAASWVRPARGDGLGAAVIGSVTRGRTATLVALGATLVAAACWFGGLSPALGLTCVAAAMAVAFVVGGVAAARLGGSTGDVLGATVEASATVVLLMLALWP
jgi:adenosylcobinamide-GDP ribazoletransferase